MTNRKRKFEKEFFAYLQSIISFPIRTFQAVLPRIFATAFHLLNVIEETNIKNTVNEKD